MSYLGPGSFKWWLQPSLRKRKRVETEETVDSESESEAGSEGSEGESEDESESEDEGMEGIFLLDVPPWIILGRRSRQDGTDWTCEDCEHFNPASQHLFVNLPAFKCGRCDAKRRIDFRFSFGNLAANGLCPIGKVLNQGNTDDCLVFALAKAAEITDRILSILLGSPYVVPTLDPYSLKETYARSREAEGIERKKINFQDEEAMERMMELMQTNGVQDVARKYTSRIGGFEEVSRNFEDIATELAKGFPLVVDILPGRSFFDLMYGEIYKCPYNDRTKPAGLTMPIHTVILVGAARVGPDDYFYFLNSYGESWCFRVHRDTHKEIGGVGKLTANDICNAPYKFWRM